MALTLEGNGFRHTLPESVDLREITDTVRLEPARIVGRRGGLATPYDAALEPQELLLSGILWGETSAGLHDLLNRLAEVLHSGELLLTDPDLGRETRVRMTSFAYQRIGGSYARMVRIAVRFLALDGVSQALYPSTFSGSVTPLTAGTVVRNLLIPYGGTTAVGPTIRISLNAGVTWTPSITWKGVNLLENASFEAGTTTPTGWTTHAGTPDIGYGGSRTGERHVLVTSTDVWRQDVPINGSATHTLSGYIRTPSSGTASVQIEWRDNAGATINTTSTTVVASTFWSRFTLTGAPSTGAAVEGRVLLGASSGTVEYDDIQLEQSASASPFADAVHVTFSRDTALDESAGDRLWIVEMDRGRARLRNASTGWSDDLHRTNGGFFDLHPSDGGQEHLFFAPPSGGNLDIEVRYRARFL